MSRWTTFSEHVVVVGQLVGACQPFGSGRPRFASRGGSECARRGRTLEQARPDRRHRLPSRLVHGEKEVPFASPKIDAVQTFGCVHARRDAGLVEEHLDEVIARSEAGRGMRQRDSLPKREGPPSLPGATEERGHSPAAGARASRSRQRAAQHLPASRPQPPGAGARRREGGAGERQLAKRHRKRNGCPALSTETKLPRWQSSRRS